MIVNCITAVIAICSATLLRIVLMRLNKQLDEGQNVNGAIAAGEAVPGDATEKGFRFVL